MEKVDEHHKFSGDFKMLSQRIDEICPKNTLEDVNMQVEENDSFYHFLNKASIKPYRR